MEATVVTRMLFSRSPLAGLALCVAALVNLVAPSLIRADVVMCGDVNGDGAVNIGDALTVAQYDVGLRTCGQGPFSHPEVCEVNGDEACNIGDALRIAQCDVGLVSCAFTCGAFACSSTTTTTSTTNTTLPSCQCHSVCTAGAAECETGCSDPCVAAVCAQDPTCCDPSFGWTALCVSEVDSFCCPSGGTCCP